MKITYWVTTILVALALLSGGIFGLMHQPDTLKGMTDLGYPVYFVNILSFWKVLGGIALLAPRLRRGKEWAYAGTFFDFTGAAASNYFAHNYGAGGFHLIVPLALAVILIISWATRPSSRRL